MAVTRKKNLTMIMNNEKRQWRWKRTRTSEQMMKNFWEDDGQFIDGEEEQTSSGFVNEKQKKNDNYNHWGCAYICVCIFIHKGNCNANR